MTIQQADVHLNQTGVIFELRAVKRLSDGTFEPLDLNGATAQIEFTLPDKSTVVKNAVIAAVDDGYYTVSYTDSLVTSILTNIGNWHYRYLATLSTGEFVPSEPVSFKVGR